MTTSSRQSLSISDATEPPFQLLASRYDHMLKNMAFQHREPSPPGDIGSETASILSSRPSTSVRSSPRLQIYPGYDSSPDPRRAFRIPEPADLTPLSLPGSPMETLPLTTTETTTSRPVGLIRRLSSAGGRRLRGRSSTTNIKNIRDQNAGSVIRRRSDSRPMPDGAQDVSDDEALPASVQEEDDDHTPLMARSTIASPRPRMLSLPRRSSTPEASQRLPHRGLSRRSSANESSSPKTTIKIPHSSTFTKVNKKKRKQIRLNLDEPAAKITWSSTSSTSTKKQVYIDDFREVRPGSESIAYMKENHETNSACWLTIHYTDPERSKGRSWKVMHLIASDEGTRDEWLNALRHIMKTRDSRMTGMAVGSEKHWLIQWQDQMTKRYGRNEHAEADERIDFAILRSICRSVSISKSDRDLQALFTIVGGMKNGTINQAQYMEFFRRLTERQDIQRIFDRFKQPGCDFLTQAEFLDFLTFSQGVILDATNRSQWIETFTKYAKKGRLSTDSSAATSMIDDRTITMSSEGFRIFLTSSANAALTPMPDMVRLDRPLNEYFISSSHNTYLAGRQIFGVSTAEMYTEALKQGCRCVEIDCADGPDGQPIVTHVGTRTTKIAFYDCIKTVDQYAFWASQYPVIISLEVHCSVEQQKVMASIMKEVFGAKLLTAPLHSKDYTLPSPEALKGRILIKAKIPRVEEPVSTSPIGTKNKVKIPKVEEPSSTSPVSKKQAHARHRSFSAPAQPGQLSFVPDLMAKAPTFPSDVLGPPVEAMTLVEPLATVHTNALPMLEINTSFSGSDTDNASDTTTTPKKSKDVSNICKELGDLGVYTRGAKWSGWDSFESQMPNHVYSFNENTFDDRSKSKDGKAALESHNLRHLMRVYPKGSRLSSGNFNPLQFWRRGVQMVATNWQTFDLGSQINNAMFAAGTDRTGYVLKPNELLRSREGPFGERVKLERKQVKLSINIISAQYLEAPSSIRGQEADMNPYVVLEMFYPEDKGKDRDGADSPGSATPSAKSSTKRTESVSGNGFDPIFDIDEQRTFNMTAVTKHPSLIFVRFSVFVSGRSSEAICTFTAKLSSLQQGYRHLPLYSRNGELLHSKLFVRIAQQAPQAWSPQDTVAGQQEQKGRWGRWLTRTPSERKRRPKEQESGYFSTT